MDFKYHIICAEIYIYKLSIKKTIESKVKKSRRIQTKKLYAMSQPNYVTEVNFQKLSSEIQRLKIIIP